jgi:uridine kinase
VGIILSISGCKAVGKSTLIEGLKKNIPNVIVREGFRKMNTGYDLMIEKEYYENQKLYLKREIEELEYFKNQKKIVILLRGPEDLEFYTFHFPKIYNKNWDIKSNLHEELIKLSKYRSDYIIYLDASIKTILKRKMNDKTKKRENMDEWLKNWQPYIEKYLKSLNNTIIFSTENLNQNEVLNGVLILIEKLLKTKS